MALPPFPAQDLAKLVLGYLMEEQLMTAYDEFLQASPYLDAFTNEYDRLCMISLKNILAEFRAMRLLVETCKPITLRRKLLQCSNLMEMLKLLILNVDLKKLCENNPVSEKHRMKTSLPVLSRDKIIERDSFHSLNSVSDTQMTIDVGATPLKDLPGNHVQTENTVRNSSCNILVTQEEVRPVEYPTPNYSHSPFAINVSGQLNTHCSTTNVNSQKMSLAGGFNNFATGVQGMGDTSGVLLDCSTPDVNNSNMASRLRINSNLSNPVIPNSNVLPSMRNGANLLLPINTMAQSNVIDGNNSNKQKVKDNEKVTILSNVKVDKNILGAGKIVEHQASLLQKTQTIFINGTPVYKTEPEISNKFTFTQDEIMAMPTIILVPSTVSADVPASANQAPSTASSLKPLTIDVTTNLPTIDITGEPDVEPIPKDTPQSQKLLLKTTDSKISSLPISQSEDKPTTPVVTRPIRKSSSTPRRTSHIRVLDFNTPRRILDQPIQEHVQNEIETVVSKSPNISLEIGKPVEGMEKTNIIKGNENVKVPAKNVTKNWDEDLRKQIYIDDSKLFTPKTSKKKKKPPENETKSIDKSLDVSNNHSKSKTKTNKKRKKGERHADADPLNIPVKPTINIITDSIKKDKNEKRESNESDKCQVTKPQVNTPENDAICLQNAIGAKLNISDFLETPFKQALYDIQMDTPRFLGPEIGGEPISDIKITNIPTPTFLNTPKVNHTPSSYSSRPTDYSSGGSYYKPDDHDYPNLLDTIEICSPSSLDANGKPTVKVLTPATDSVNVEEKGKVSSGKKRSTRPVRQCTRNVSYCNTPVVNKPKSPKKSSSESSKDLEICENIKEYKPKPKERRKSTSRSTPKIKAKLKSTFIKSPTKENINKHRKSVSRKRTNSKDKDLVTTIMAPAPTKSRRKSSTPRKLHCTKAFNESAEKLIKVTFKNVHEKSIKWSDEGCHERNLDTSLSEVEDITKIKEFIENTQTSKVVTEKIEINTTNSVKVHIVDDDSSDLHVDLIKRGFDLEVAKTIERDLSSLSPKVAETDVKDTTKGTETGPDIITSSNISSDLDIEQEVEDLEFSVHEFNEESSNFKSIKHEEGARCTNAVSFKDNFTMDICIEDIVIRLKTTPYTDLFDEEPMSSKQIEHTIVDDDVLSSRYETEAAVQSISYIDKLYTPRKEMTEEEQAKCKEIFDSSLVSLDTPLKPTSPIYKEVETKVPRRLGAAEVTLEIESIDEPETTVKEKSLGKKRKRLRSGSTSEDSTTEPKKSKPQYLKNIQNFDIESVLSRLHGP